MNPEIIVTVKSVYGLNKCYPVCDQAKTLAKLARTTTLTHHSIETIRSLGFIIKTVSPDMEKLLSTIE